jgi:hypothetical protein
MAASRTLIAPATRHDGVSGLAGVGADLSVGDVVAAADEGVFADEEHQLTHARLVLPVSLQVRRRWRMRSPVVQMPLVLPAVPAGGSTA